MSLWLALLWFACCALGFGVFILCRKRMADIGHDVREEVDHQIRGILKAAREAEEQLRDAFADFRNPSAAVQSFQKARSEIPGVPRATPPWNWADTDLELLRKRSVADETARRCRPPVVASIVGVLALTLGTAVATVILSNSVQPLMTAPAPAPLANAASNAGNSLTPPLLPTPVNLPTLPQAAPVPADIASNPPSAAAQGTGNGTASAQGGALTQPVSSHAGQPQASPTTTTSPSSTTGGSPSPQDNPPTLPQASPTPAVSAGNAANVPIQDASTGVSSAKTVPPTNPSQSGVTP